MHNNYKKLVLGTKKYISNLSINGHMLFKRRAEWRINTSKTDYNY